MYTKELKGNFLVILKCISNHNTKATGHEKFNHKCETTNLKLNCKNHLN